MSDTIASLSPPDAAPAWTVAGQIERCTDLDKLRAWAKEFHAVMLEQHDLIAHTANSCAECMRAAEECDPDYACAEYHRRHERFIRATCLI